MKNSPTSCNLLFLLLTLNATNAHRDGRMTIQCLTQHRTKDQMAQTKTYFKREDVASKGILMQIRSTVKLLTHAISQCLPITNWNGALIVLSEQKTPG